MERGGRNQKVECEYGVRIWTEKVERGMEQLDTRVRKWNENIE